MSYYRGERLENNPYQDLEEFSRNPVVRATFALGQSAALGFGAEAIRRVRERALQLRASDPFALTGHPLSYNMPRSGPMSIEAGTRRSRSSRGSLRSVRRRRFAGASTEPRIAPGSYVGSFKKPNIVRKKSKSVKAGYTSEYDIKGDHNQDECVTFGVRSLVPYEAARGMGIAFIRKIMKKHYMIEYSDEKQGLLHGFTSNDATTGTVGGPPLNDFVSGEYYMAGTNGTGSTTATYPLGWAARSPKYLYFFREVNTDSSTPFAVERVSTAVFEFGTSVTAGTLGSFGDWFASNVVLSGSFGSASDPTKRLWGYQFVEYDALAQASTLPGGTAQGVLRPQAIMGLDGMYVSLKMFTDFMVQNVTVADNASGDQYDSNRIDSNPIKGKIFKFSTTLPRIADVRRMGTFGGNNVAASTDVAFTTDGSGSAYPDGILKGNTVSGLPEFSGVPVASMFRNCVGEQNVFMQPGQIKNIKTKFKFDGLLWKFIHGFGETKGTAFYYTGGNALEKQFGTSYLFSFEQVIRNGAGNVKVAYEAHRVMYAVVKKVLPVCLNKSQRQDIANQG